MEERRPGFSPFFKQHRPAGEELGISCKEQDGKEDEKERDGALCKAGTQPVTRVTRLTPAAPRPGRRVNVRRASLYAPQFPVLLHDHGLGFGLRLGSLVLPETQPAWGSKGGDHAGMVEPEAPGADAELPRTQAPVEEGDPQPAHQQEDEHEREGEREPGAEVDQFAVWKIAGRQRKRLTPPDLGPLERAGGGGCFSYVFSCPIRMRLGAVPVSVAVPPMLAA